MRRASARTAAPRTLARLLKAFSAVAATPRAPTGRRWDGWTLTRSALISAASRWDLELAQLLQATWHPTPKARASPGPPPAARRLPPLEPRAADRAARRGRASRRCSSSCTPFTWPSSAAPSSRRRGRASPAARAGRRPAVRACCSDTATARAVGLAVGRLVQRTFSSARALTSPQRSPK